MFGRLRPGATPAQVRDEWSRTARELRKTLQAIDPGVRLEGLVQTRVSLPAARYATQPALERFLALATEELRRVPGIERVAAANALPLSALNIRTDFTIVGMPPPSAADIPGAQNRWVTAGYFETLGIRVLDGRGFTDADVTARAPVAVVDGALAARFWPDGKAVGSGVRILDGTPEGRVLEVVGIVGNVTHFDIGESPLGTLYGIVQQLPPPALGFFTGSFMFAARGTDSEQMRRGIVEAIRRVDPDVPTTTPWTMSDQLGRILASRRFVAVMLVLFATAALLLAVSGVYTVVSAAAREQARELTIRLALGASRAAMLKTVLVLAGRVLALGIPIGMLLTTVAKRLVGDVGLIADDWRLWMLTPLALCAAALSASYMRARRVLTLDPATTLRGE